MTLEQLRKDDLTDWADHYVEPHTGALYRRDARGNWYDVEGVRLAVPVFLRGDVLVSLPGKISRRSFAFRGQTLLISPRGRFLQVGKLVLDAALQPVRYFGDRLAGLGPTYVDLGEGEAWQEVLISLDRRGFLNETDARPLVIEGEEITRFWATERRSNGGFPGGSNGRFHVFSSATRRFVVEGSTEDVVRVNGRAVDLDFSTYLRFQDREVIRTRSASLDEDRAGGSNDAANFYIDLATRQPFYAPSLGEVLIHELEEIDGFREDLYRVRTSEATFIFDARDGDVFSIDGGSVYPQRIRLHPTFPGHLLVVEADGERFICDKETRTTLAVGPGLVKVAQVRGKPGDRLLPATGSRGEKLVLDTAEGLDHLTLATVEGLPVESLSGEPFRLGGRIVQACVVRQAGGSLPRLAVLNEPDLPAFTLPADLRAYDDQPQPSIFAGRPILSVDRENPVEIGEHVFFPVTFVAFTGAEERALINRHNGRPLHLDGDGHRNELVTQVIATSRARPHHLGRHRMLSARTLTEDHQPGELLFSADDLRSWIPFFDGYLPILRRVVPFDASGAKHKFVLFELRETGGTGEYLAVERHQPYRVLVQQLDGRYIPNIITNKDRVPANPEEVGRLRGFLLRAGELVEVL